MKAIIIISLLTVFLSCTNKKSKVLTKLDFIGTLQSEELKNWLKNDDYPYLDTILSNHFIVSGIDDVTIYDRNNEEALLTFYNIPENNYQIKNNKVIYFKPIDSLSKLDSNKLIGNETYLLNSYGFCILEKVQFNLGTNETIITDTITSNCGNN